MGALRGCLLLIVATSPAWADPNPQPAAPPPPAPVQHPRLVLMPMSLSGATPQLPPVSLRLEAVRVATEAFDNSWRYPVPGAAVGLDGNGWFVGVGHYHPKTARSAALHGGSIATTIAGEILVGSGSPLAGVGALLTGATLDAAAADVDRDAESRHPSH